MCLLEQTLAWAQQKLEQTNTLQPILEKLYQAQTLSQQESHQLFSAVARGELNPEQLAAVLVTPKLVANTRMKSPGGNRAAGKRSPFPRPDHLFADMSVPAATAATALISPPAPLSLRLAG
ncbi:hypothetical protein ACNKHK_08040 [Shigella flexneri]